MFKWFKQKAVDKSASNIESLIEQLIEVANQADSNIQQTGGMNAADKKAMKHLQKQLMIQLCGPIPLEDVKTKYIDPALKASNVSEGA
ncbi:MAG: hypothetical protein JRH09_19005, partial [Deltaproteobacteria bacterium]|nr:hypothetical protein [Deltaproteobacteria bacterium]